MRLSVPLLTPLLLAMSPAMAQSMDTPYEDPYYAQSPVENVSYGYAQVLRAEEVVETVRVRTQEERCDDAPVESANGRKVGGTLIGAIVGAALGNQVGKGHGRQAATVAGAVAGGVAGNKIASDRAEAQAQGCHLVEVEREEPKVVGYDVEYMYRGEKYMSRLAYDPGNRLRVRVSVMPDETADASR
jgi:uncharacterized protein YcfJ